MKRMTVSECLKEWLIDFDGLDFSEILTDFIDAPSGCLALFKSPNKQVIEYADGSSQNTEYYQFFARMATQIQEQRANNLQVISELENWIEEKETDEYYPDLSKAGNMICSEIGVTNTGTISSQQESDAIYQITIKITYLKER